MSFGHQLCVSPDAGWMHHSSRALLGRTIRTCRRVAADADGIGCSGASLAAVVPGPVIASLETLLVQRGGRECRSGGCKRCLKWLEKGETSGAGWRRAGQRSKESRTLVLSGRRGGKGRRREGREKKTARLCGDKDRVAGSGFHSRARARNWAWQGYQGCVGRLARLGEAEVLVRVSGWGATGNGDERRGRLRQH